MISAVIITSVIIIITIIIVRRSKQKIPWITKDEITRLEELWKKRGEK